MKETLHGWLLLVSVTITVSLKESDLPLCPSNIQYFPQKLPMHCRMPTNQQNTQFPVLPQYPTLPPLPESFYQSPPPNKLPPPIPFPIPPFPGMPGPPGGGPMPGMPGLMPGMPGPMPMPMPMLGGPPHKLPVIVMPFYSPDNSFKKQPKDHHHGKKKKLPHKKKKRPSFDIGADMSSDYTDYYSDTDTDIDTSHSSEHGYWRGHKADELRTMKEKKETRRFLKTHKMRHKERKNKKKDLLTPILQYVTKDGYVIFEKKISKSEAKDWLKPKAEVNEIEEEGHHGNDGHIIQKGFAQPHKTKHNDVGVVRIEDRSDETKDIEVSTKKNTNYSPKKVNQLIDKPSLELY